MKLQQLRYLAEVARQGLNVSAAAEALHTSQPGVSRAIADLEDELGVQVFARHGKRLIAITEPGRDVLALAGRILADVASLKRAGEDHADSRTGTLVIATTHTQARYALPKAVAAFKRRYPGVQLQIHQGNPTQICEMVRAGDADLCVATEAIAEYADLVSLPCYEWNRSIVVPEKHPLLKDKPLTLEAVARYPIVTYDFAFANRSLVQTAFERRGLSPNVVLAALDADVIKTYVELGLGVGIMASMAFDARRDAGLKAIDASHLFPPSTTRLGMRRGAYVKGYAYDFIERFAPRLTRAVVQRSLEGGAAEDYSL